MSAAATIEEAEDAAYVPAVTGTYCLVESIAEDTHVVGRPHEAQGAVGYQLKVRRAAWERKGYVALEIDFHTVMSKKGFKRVWLRTALTCTLPPEVVAAIR